MNVPPLPSDLKLKPEDREMVILAALVDGPKMPDELDRICEWADNAHIDAMLLRLILAGEIVPSWDSETADLRVKIAPPKGGTA